MELRLESQCRSAGELEVVNPLLDSEWDDSVLTHPDSTVFHSAAWARVLSSTYGHHPIYLRSWENHALHVLFPMMEVKSWLSGLRGVSLPFTDFCDPLLSEGVDFENVFQAALQLGRSRKWKYLEARIGSATTGFTQPSLEFFGHALDLTPPEEAIFAGMTSNLRNEIRKAGRSGVEIVLATDSASISHYYDLHCLTRRKHGLPPQPFAFFSTIRQHLLTRGLGFVALAFLNRDADGKSAVDPDLFSPVSLGSSGEAPQGRRPIAAAVYLNFGKHAVYKFSASDEAYQKLPAGKLAMWRAVQYLKATGIETMDMGRTSLANKGLRRYKQAWGAKERPVANFKYHLAENRFLTERDKVSGWHNRIFRFCPQAVSRCLGGLLYPHMD